MRYYFMTSGYFRFIRGYVLTSGVGSWSSGPRTSLASFCWYIYFLWEFSFRSIFYFRFYAHTTSASPRPRLTSKAIAVPAGYCHTNTHYAVELITISIVTIRIIWHSAADFCVLENFRRKFAILVAPPTDGTTKRLVRCKAHPVL